MCNDVQRENRPRLAGPSFFVQDRVPLHYKSVLAGKIRGVDLKIRSENEDSCVVLNVTLRPLYIHQIGDK